MDTNIVHGNELVWSAVLAWVSAKGIEWMKSSRLFPAVTYTSETVNRWLARVVAVAAAIGVHTTFDSSAGVLTITGLTFIGIRDSALEVARQIMLTQIAYKKFVRPEATAPNGSAHSG